MSDYEYIRPDGPFACMAPSDRVWVMGQENSKLQAIIARLRAENAQLRDELAALRAGTGHTFRVNADGEVEKAAGVKWTVT
jgi:hypothetical protein